MWILAASLFVIALGIWELWICEGAHLGKRFVVWLYDLAANRYDRIKKFDPDWEQKFLGEPLAGALSSYPEATMLDVGAGTGRSMRALSQLIAGPPPRIVALEPSRRMLKLGRLHSGAETAWLRGWAVPLPFADHSFDLAVALEMLEFTPHPAETLNELFRVLRPGGLLLITNRVSWEARLIFGRTHPRKVFPKALESAGFQGVTVYPWQMDYDLAWAHKP